MRQIVTQRCDVESAAATNGQMLPFGSICQAVAAVATIGCLSACVPDLAGDSGSGQRRPAVSGFYSGRAFQARVRVAATVRVTGGWLCNVCPSGADCASFPFGDLSVYHSLDRCEADLRGTGDPAGLRSFEGLAGYQVRLEEVLAARGVRIEADDPAGATSVRIDTVVVQSQDEALVVRYELERALVLRLLQEGALQPLRWAQQVPLNVRYPDGDQTSATISIEVDDEVDGLRFPEYDRLLQRGETSIAVLFGLQRGSEATDLGQQAHTSFVKLVGGLGFRRQEDGSYLRLAGAHPVSLHVVSPRELDGGGEEPDMALQRDVIRDAIAKHDVVVVNAHGIYGTGEDFAWRAADPDRYQILFASGCNSYNPEGGNYQTDFGQLVAQKTRHGDNLDLVVNVEVAFFLHIARVNLRLVRALVAGLEHRGFDPETQTALSWQHIIDEMTAVVRPRNHHGERVSEIFAVYPIHTNVFRPW